MRRWLVIGGGPCGLGYVGSLLDKGMKVTWVDPSFTFGRLGQYYRKVPANTPNGDLVVALNLCSSFRYTTATKKFRPSNARCLSRLPEEECAELGLLVDALSDVSHFVTQHENLQLIRGEVTKLFFTSDKCWQASITTASTTPVITESDAVILAVGAHPTIPPEIAASPSLLQRIKPLDYMVCPEYVANAFVASPELRSKEWTVVGSSHSAMLVVMNLIENGAQHVRNLYRSDFRYQHMTPHGWKRYQGTGLKGPVGDWVRFNASHPALERIRVSGETGSLLPHLPDTSDGPIVCAIGYTRNALPAIHLHDRSEPLSGNTYHRDTGALLEAPNRNIFGGGIAYPQDTIEGDGRREPWVGFKRSIEQTELMTGAYHGIT